MANINDPFKPAKPGGIVDPFAQKVPHAQPADQSPRARPTRTLTQAGTDTLRSLASGVGTVVEGFGTVGGLVTGNMDNAVTRLGQSVQDHWQEGQSEQLKYDRERRSEAVSRADGVLGQAGTYIKETATNPALLVDTIAETAASMIPAGAAGRVGSVVSGARALSRGATPAQAARHGARVGTAAGIGTGGVQAGADASGGAYQAAMERDESQWNNNPEYVERVAAGESPEAVKHEMALAAARVTFGGTLPLSLASQAIPGGATIERAVAGAANRAGARSGIAARGLNAAVGGAGEAVQEAIEEGGGQFIGNLAQRAYVDPQADITEGVGEALGGGIVAGGGLGAVTGAARRPRSLSDSDSTGTQPPPNAPDPGPQLALPPPGPVVVDPDGSATTAADRDAQQRADVEFAQDRATRGLTPDVNAARAQHPGATPNTLPDGSPVPDPAAGPLSRAANVGVNNGAVQQSAMEQALYAEAAERGAAVDSEAVEGRRRMTDRLTEMARDEQAADSSQGPRQPALIEGESTRVPRNVDPETGEVAAPNRDEIKAYLHGQLDRNGTLPKVSAFAKSRGMAPREASDLIREVRAERRALATSAEATDAQAPRGSDTPRTADPAGDAVDAGRVSSPGAAGEGVASVPVAAEADGAAETQRATPDQINRRLPKDLARAAPRYSYGDKKFTLAFESDADRAAYITAQARQSKRDSDYLRFAMDATGLDEAGVRARGAEIRESIKAMARDSEPGRLSLPAFEGQQEAAPVATAPTAAAAPAQADGFPITEHTTGRGRTLRGTVRTDLDSDQARRIDGGTFKKDGGWFIRERDFAKLRAFDAEGGQVAAAGADAATSPTSTAPEPTEAQKEAGNYKKGHVRLNGHNISIENPAGSRRRPEWSPLQDAYGYIRGTVGRDKDHVDVFMTDRAGDAELPVFVVDQVDQSGKFDEHKVVMGTATEEEARETYLRNYQDGWTGLGAITQMTQDEFKTWVRDPAATSRRAAAGATETPAPAKKATKKAATPRPTEGASSPAAPAAERRLVDEAPNGIKVGDRVVVNEDRNEGTGRSTEPYEGTVRAIEINAPPAYGGTAFHVARDDATPDGRGTGWVGIDRLIPAPGSSPGIPAAEQAAAATLRRVADEVEQQGDPWRAAMDEALESVPASHPMRKKWEANAKNGLKSEGDRAATLAQVREAAVDRRQSPTDPAGQIVEVQDVYGVTHRVHRSDLDGDRERILLYNKNGTPKTGNNRFIVRDNIDLTGDRSAERQQRLESRVFDVVTKSDGGAFKTAAAAKAYATKNGYGETHEPSPAGEGYSGFVLRRISADSEAAPDGETAPQDAVTARPVGTGATAITIDPSASEAATGPQVSENTVFTADAAERARAVLRAKLGQLNTGLDPEVMQAGITLAGYHIERGARTFAAFGKAMLTDLGESVRPYLKSWYSAIRLDPRATGFEGMDSLATVESADVDALTAESTDATPAQEATDGNDSQPARSEADGQASDAGADAGGVSPDGEVGRPGDLFGAPSAGNDRADARAERPKRRAPARKSASRKSAPDRGDQESSGRAGVGGNAVDGKPGSRNFNVAPGGLTREGSWMEAARRNVDAMALALQLDREGRLATPEEQAQLARYVGFGSTDIANRLFPQAAGRGSNYNPDVIPEQGWRAIGQKLKETLSAEQLQTVMRSTQYAHYTSEAVTRGIWSAMERMGFKGGKVFEPGMGHGAFPMTAPPSLASKLAYTGLEMDHLTALIGRQLVQGGLVLRSDFTKQKLPNDTFDIAVGNPPFASTVVTADPDYRRHRFMLHDYFFAKTIDKVRPGGLMAFVTSAGTMNKGSEKARQYISERADLLGAIRLPDTAFLQNAGTEVVTDILFFRKRLPDEQPGGEAWMKLEAVQAPQADGTMAETLINEYFVAHPEMVMGEHSMTGKMRGRPNAYNVKLAEGQTLESMLPAAIERLPAGVFEPAAEKVRRDMDNAAVENDLNPDNRKEGGLYLKDGRVMVTRNGAGRLLESSEKLSPRESAWLGDAIGLRDTLKRALDDQRNNRDWKKSLKALEKAYKAFTKKHGPINAFSESQRTARYYVDEGGNEVSLKAGQEPPAGFDAQERTIVTRRFKNKRLLAMDVESPLLAALETETDDGKMVGGAQLTRRSIAPPAEPRIESTADALVVSLNRTGYLDVEQVAELAGVSTDQAIADLGDRIYQNPLNDEWVMADAYLSGDVVTALEEAEAAARSNPAYSRNVEALRKVQPEPLAPRDITVQLGMAWLQGSTIDQFAREVLGVRNAQVAYSENSGLWSVNAPKTNAARQAEGEFNHADRSAGEILDAVLNNREIKVTRTERVDGRTRSYLDTEATTAVNEIAKRMRQRFGQWIWEDADRAQDIAGNYNAMRNRIVPRTFDGEFLDPPGLALMFKPDANGRGGLHPHQKRAIWRQIQTGTTYLNHAVGAGKTLEMIIGAMEQKRLGLISKPMFTVPNHMLGQFSAEFLEAYPAANIMVADEDAFTKDKRRQFVAAATVNAPDAIIIPHSAMRLLRVKPETMESVVADMVADLEAALEETDDRITVKKLEGQLERLKQRVEGKSDSERQDDVVFFEDMGVDMLYVDEAHEFRKLDFVTNRQNVKGIDPQGSAKALDLYAKVRFLHGQRPGRSHVFASGTAITNTMGELFTVQKFMDYDGLREAGLHHFDAWASEYGEVVTEYERNAAGQYRPVDRFSKFNNIPELMLQVRDRMDVLTSSQLGELVKRPDVDTGGPQMVVADPSGDLSGYMQGVLAPRIEKSLRWKPSRDQPHNPDPMLAIIGDARLAVIDMRFVDPTAESDPNSKLNQMIDRIIERHHEFANIEFEGQQGKGATQIVFSPIGFGEGVARRRGFDARAWMNSRLRESGIPQDQIAWMSDLKNSKKRQAAFKEMRAGRIRILVGSPANMGTGVNVQSRLRALHFLSPPWYPSDVEQPHGRILRQGNMNPEVELLWYVTEGTYDSTGWGMVARKGRFIEQVMRADRSLRSAEDISEVSQYALASALASGDDRAVRVAELEADIGRLRNLQGDHETTVHNARSELFRARNMLESNEKRLERAEAAREALDGDHIRADGFAFHVGDQPLPGESRAEVGAEIGRRIRKAIPGAARLTVQGGFDGEIGSLSGKYPLVVHARPGAGSTVYVDVDVMVGPLRSPVLESVNFESLPLTPQEGLGFTTRLMNAVNRVDSLPDEIRSTLAAGRKRVDLLEKRVAAPWPQERELFEKVAELSNLQQEMAAENDAATEAAAQAGETPALSRPDRPAGGGMAAPAVRSAIDSITSTWTGEGAPAVEVVATADALPDHAKADPAHATAEGFYDERTATVYLVAANLRNAKRAREVLAHEAVGHYGVEAITGPQLWRDLTATIDRMRASGRQAELFAEIDRRYRGANSTIATREAIAVMAEKGVRNSVVDRATTALRRFLRSLGFNMRFSEAELRQHLVTAARYVRSGVRPRVAQRAAESAGAFSRRGLDLNKRVPVVSIAGGAFGDTVSNLPEARSAAQQYLRRLRDSGRKMLNEDTGWRVGLSAASIRELLQFDAEKVNLLLALPRITRAAILADSSVADRAAVGSRESVKAFHTLYAPVTLNGDLRLARLVVREDVNGAYAYDLQQSAILDDGSPAFAGLRQAGIPRVGGGARPSMTVAQLRDAVNAQDTPGWAWSKADPVGSARFQRWFQDSKVTHPAGAPKVVYHGTASEFWAFDAGRLSESTGHMTAPLGFFFDENRGKAQRYAENAADGVPADERVIDAFLSIQNPKRMTLEELQAIEDYDQARALRTDLQRQGHDGIHLADQGQWIAFEPTQVKSASDNTGEFNPENADLRFSRPDAVIDAVDSAAGPPSSVGERLKSAFRSLNPRDLRENTRPTWLGALTLRMLAELGKDINLDQVGQYADRVQTMATDRNIMQEEVSKTADTWEKFQRKDRVGADATANLMHDTTLAGVDPSTDYRPLFTGTTQRGGNEPVTRESIDRRKALVEADLRVARGAEGRMRLTQELEKLDALMAQEEERRAAYPGLVQRFQALPDAGQRLYVDVRDAYTRQSERVQEALEARINALELDGRQKKAMIDQVRQNFESARLSGPYFPLQRFGDFWISAENDAGEQTFLMYERVQDWREAQRELKDQGLTIKNAGRRLDEARSLAGASGGFVSDLIGMLEESGVDLDTRDEVYQLYLRTLPDLSMRKHQIHRKGTAGYSKDALRAFSANMFHGSFQIARLRHTHELEADLLMMKKAVSDMTADDPERAAKAGALYSETNRRHEWVMNPRDSRTASTLTSMGFAWFLGTTPAAALVNLSQTAIVTYPVLASRFGAGRAFTALSEGMGRALRNVDGNMTRGLNSEERAAFKVWYESGAIDRSQAHNLAGLSETDTRAYSNVQRKGMEVVSWMFHRAEVANREASALAAFRLARQAGQSFNEATKYAEEVVIETHFDYSNANRARWMQSNTAKVLLLFRQHSLNMTWFLWRNLYLSTRGQAPEVRKEARAKMAGVLGMTGVFAGALGLPLMSVIFGVANAAAAAFGDDDDDPFDAEVAFRNFLADMLGPEVGRIVARGPVDALTGAGISGRVSLDQLWFREPNRELEGKARAHYLLEQAAGPIFGGMLVNTLRGMQQVGEGHTWRGVETMMPKALKDGMKSIRYAQDGVNTMRGDPVIEDLSVGESLLQLAGFSPARLNERYDGINAAKNFEERLMRRRSSLLNAYALAWRAGDTETVRKVMEDIRAFNARQPALAINASTIRQSLKARLRYSSRAEGGVVLNPRVAPQAREQARFVP